MGLYLGNQRIGNLGETFSLEKMLQEINKDILSAYSEISAMGGTLPEVLNSKNLAQSIRTIPQ